MRKKIFKNVEWSILICSVILCAIGMIALFSATHESGDNSLQKQIIWFWVCIPVVILVICIDYELIVKIAPYLYGIIVILLVAVLFTKPINGASSWFDFKVFSFQPAELAKIIVVLTLASLMCKLQGKNRDDINKPKNLGIIFLVLLVPIALILKQPDIGTASAFLVAIALMLYVSGIKKKYIIVTIILVAISIPLLYYFILPDHAVNRIDVFLNPDLDPRGAGYNVRQSKLAIGAGQLFGMGLLKGNQTQLGFLHPKTTDFIYSLIAEEMGFLVAAIIIVLYIVLITKAIYIAKTAKDDIGSYIAIGITGIFIFHMVENIGMTMGILPITGVPLPFVSYGGSSLLTNFILIGILLNISGRRQKAIFVE